MVLLLTTPYKIIPGKSKPFNLNRLSPATPWLTEDRNPLNRRKKFFFFSKHPFCIDMFDPTPSDETPSVQHSKCHSLEHHSCSSSQGRSLTFPGGAVPEQWSGITLHGKRGRLMEIKPLSPGKAAWRSSAILSTLRPQTQVIPNSYTSLLETPGNNRDYN